MFSSIRRYFVLRRLALVSSLKTLSDVDPQAVYEILKGLQSSGVIEKLQDRAQRKSAKALSRLQSVNDQLSYIYSLCRTEVGSGRENRQNWQTVMDLCTDIYKLQGRLHTGEFRRRATID